MADRNAPDRPQQTAQTPLGQQPIDPVGIFRHVLDRQNGPFQSGLQGRIEQISNHRQVPRKQATHHGPAAPTLALKRFQGLTRQQIKQAIDRPGRFLAQGGEQGPMHTRHPLPGQTPQQSRNV